MESRWRSGWSCGGIKASVSRRPWRHFVFPFSKASPFSTPDLTPLSLDFLFLLFMNTIFHLTAAPPTVSRLVFRLFFFVFMQRERKVWFECHQHYFEFTNSSISLVFNEGLGAGNYPVVVPIPPTPCTLVRLMFVFLDHRGGGGGLEYPDNSADLNWRAIKLIISIVIVS